MSAKKVCKKALSVILALTLMLTTFVCFDIGMFFGSAVDTNAAITISDNEVSNVYFYAPEQVYLEPSLTGYTAQGKYKYQWFVDSTINETTNDQTLRTGENSEGNFYFYYENASQVTISYKYLNADFSEMTAYTSTSTTNSSADYANANCNIKLASYATPLRAINTSGTSSYIYYTVSGNKINTTLTRESSSPYLLAATKGYYIEWKAAFIDKLDGQTKVAYAYTYVYKPFIQPVGVAQQTENNTGTNHMGQCISWITGVHGLATEGSHYPNSAAGTSNLVTFSSSNPQGVLLGSTDVKNYAQFATEIYTNGYLKYTGIDNNKASDWINSDGGNSPYTPYKSFNFNDKNDGGNFHSYSVYNKQTAPVSTLTVDVSRYTNLGRIPNFTAGIMVTNDKNSDNGAWYVADGTGMYDSSDTMAGREQSSTSKASALYNNYKAIIANQGGFGNRGDYETEGVKYNGPANINVLDTSNATYSYSIRAGYHNYQGGDSVTNVAVMPLTVTQTNKDALRYTFNHATNVVAKFGLTADGSSVYYNTGNANWSKFVTLYQLAGKMLANLDLSSTTNVSGYDLNSVVSELESAISGVENEARISSTASVRFLALSKTANGYKLIELHDEDTNSNVADVSKTFYLGQKVNFNALSFSGYDYVGASAGLKDVDTQTGSDYSSVLTTTDSVVTVPFANDSSQVQYTFLYAQKEYSTIVDTRGGDFNLLNVINSDYPAIGGMAYPTYSADTSVDTDLNYTVSGNDVTVWTTEETTLAKHQFLPYEISVEPSTSYVLKYKVAGTDPSNISFTLYGANFTGGDGETTSHYVIGSSNSVITTNAVDSGKAYLRVELLGDARNGKKIMISDLCFTKADRNELYIQTSAEYPTNFVATSADKNGMSYTAISNSSFTVTSQYNSSTYDQRQLLPYYVNLKPNGKYVINYEVSGLDASNIRLDLVNDTFTGGNGSTLSTYSFASSGSQITVGTSDDGAAQLKVTYASGIAAGTKATITNLSITNLDTKTTITGKFSDLVTLGIPVKEGYKFAGWTVKANDGSTSAYGSVTETIPGSLYQYKFGTGIDVVEAQWTTDTCTVIFRNYNGVIVDEQTVAYGSAANSPTTTPTRFGYTFNSWDTDFSAVTQDLIIEPVYDEINIDVILDNSTLSTYEGSQATLQATFSPNEPEISEITWTSSAPAIATVTGTTGNRGIITGVSAGTAVITATVTYNGKTYSESCNVTVIARKPTSVEVVTAPTKTEYFVGDTFDPTGMQIQVTYNNGTKSDYSNYDFSSLPGTVTFATVSTATTGTKTVRLTYKENGTSVTATTKITVVAVKPTKIEFSGTPDKTFYVGDTSTAFDETGLDVKVTYNNGTIQSYDASELDITYSGFDTTTARTITMTGTYEGLSASFDVVINPVELVSVAVNTMPNKTDYYVGEDFDQTGLTLTATYNNGSTGIIFSGITCTGFSSTSAGSKTITASYGGKSTTFYVDIVALKLVSIAVKTNPTKVSYYAGESLDTTGLTLTGTYNNGTTDTITTGYTCTGFSSETAGTKTVTVNYQGLTTTFNVTVLDATIVSVAVKTMPDKVSYFVGDSFDQTGLTLEATFSDGTTAIISSGITCTGFSSSETGTTTVTATYDGKSTSFDVTIKAVELIGIEITVEPTKTTFNTGDELDTTGLVLTLKYNNTTSTITEGFTTSGYNTNTAGEQTITVSYGGFSDTYKVTLIQSYADYTGVDAAIETANEKIATGYYTDDSVAALNEAINAVVRGLKADEQATVDGYEAEILDKTEKLVMKDADYSAVETAKTAAAEEIAKGIYTDESVAALQAAVDAVVEGKKIDEQSAVEGYAKAINDMILALEEKPSDFSKIDELYTEIENYDPDLYTNYDEIFYDYIFDFYLSDVGSAKLTYTKISQQSEVDKLYDQLVAYRDMLILKDAKVAKFELKNGAAYKTSGGVKYIVGLRTGLTDATLKSSFFETENVTVTVTRAMGRFVGTGSTVTVTSTLDGSVVGEYVVLIYGDISGDGQISMVDTTALANSLNKSTTLTAAQKLAANVNGDRSVNLVDHTLLSNVIQKTATINQATGKVV